MPATSLTRLLRARGGPHPLGDALGRVPVTVRLPEGAVAETYGLLPVAPGVGAIRLTSNELETFSALHPELAIHYAPPRWPQLDVSAIWTQAAAYRASSGQRGKGVVLGVIDTGIDLGHPDFRDATGKTRVAWMLVASQPLGLHPELEDAYGCTSPNQSSCAILSADDINLLLGSPGASYPRDPEGHGTHVTSIAGGNGGPSVNEVPRYVGMAPEATLVIAAPAAPGTGFRDPDILNAARFVFERAEAMGMPAVLNLSVGGDFGPHDGTSDLEAGLGALVGDDKPGRSIVVAAGNSGALYDLGDGRGPYGVHTETYVAPHAEVTVPIATPSSKSGQGFIWITFRPGDEVAVGLVGPDGETWVDPVSPGEEAGYEGDDGTTGAVINRLVNGKTPMTAQTNSAVVAMDGAWSEGEFTITLEGSGHASLWVVGQGDVDPAKSNGLLFAKGLKQGTINVPASHPNLIAVGCTVNRLTWDPIDGERLELVSLGGNDRPRADDICYFSAAGPTPFGVPKPEITAPGAFVGGAMSADADPRKDASSIFAAPGCPDNTPCYVLDDWHALTSGTSMSAPHVAGAVALLFEKDPTLTQARVRDILQAGAQYPTGSVPSQTQLGPGALDLVGAERVMLETAGQATSPDMAQSWYVLSSAYARPDASWPVVGYVELRDIHRAPVLGLDGTDLHLSVDNGVVVENLTRVGEGMWRFGVAGAPGHGGEVMLVDVKYKGTSLCSEPDAGACGPRELPIGLDAWSAVGGVGAEGGWTCGVGPSRPVRRGDFAWILLGAALLVGRRSGGTRS